MPIDFSHFRHKPSLSDHLHPHDDSLGAGLTLDITATAPLDPDASRPPIRRHPTPLLPRAFGVADGASAAHSAFSSPEVSRNLCPSCRTLSHGLSSPRPPSFRRTPHNTTHARLGPMPRIDGDHGGGGGGRSLSLLDSSSVSPSSSSPASPPSTAGSLSG